MVRTADRRRLERQAEALRAGEHADEGTPEWRRRFIADADARRARLGIPPLKTEGELHRRARALGLLDPLPRPAR